MKKKSIRFIFHKDHLYTTIWVMVVSIILIFIPLNLSIFDPVARMFEDFRFSDFYMRLTDRSNKPQSNEVFVVDIAPLRDRAEIANVLLQIADVEPKVISLDILFEHDNKDASSREIAHVIDSINTPIVEAVEWTNSDEVITSFFTGHHSLSGYVNTTLNNTYSKCLRSYTTSHTSGGIQMLSLAMQTALVYKPELSWKEDKERIIDFSSVDIAVLSPDEISQYAERMKGKIVIVGLASGNEDIHLTPVGDMYGSIILGLAMQSMLDGYDIKNMSQWGGVIFAVILTYLFIVFCSYTRIRHWANSNIIIKLTLLGVTILLVFINLLSSLIFHYNINLIYALIGLVFTSDVLSFYIAALVAMRKRGWVKHPERRLYL